MHALTLTSDVVEVVVLPEAGARVHSIRAFGQLLTHTPADPTTHQLNPIFWGGYHMLPWCNRVEPGPYPLLGQRFAVPANSIDGTALHGLHYVSPWDVDATAEAVDKTTTTLRCGGGGDGEAWPWTYTASVRYAVDGPTLTVAYELTNTSARTMPGGVGFHPWFREPTTLHVPAAHVFPDNTDTAVRPHPARGPLDLRTPAALAVGTDACWVGLDAPVVTLAWHELGIALTMAADDPGIVAVAANPPDRDGVAVELQTHAPAGIRRLLNAEPYALHALGAGETLSLTLTLAHSRLP